MTNVSSQIVIGTFLGWLFRLNPDEPNQQDFEFTTKKDADDFLAAHCNDPLSMFSRYHGSEGIDLDGGYGPTSIPGSPAYMLTCKCGKHCWTVGIPTRGLSGTTCSDCVDAGVTDDFNNYDGSLMMDKEY